MKLVIFQIDAFASRPFEGNPAAVLPLPRWLPDGLMQSIAMELNLPETAFFIPKGSGYEIRWFTPESEMDLCGHATLASAFVIFSELEPSKKQIEFTSQSGPLTVWRDGERICLDFPSRPAEPILVPEGLSDALGAKVLEAGQSRDMLCVLESESAVRNLKPDFQALAKFDTYGIIATAQGDRVDCVSRCFFPKEVITEDPVTGSSHCTIIPYWAKRLGKPRIHARQVSARSGELFCELRGERVMFSGQAVKVMQGHFHLGDGSARRG